MDRRETIKTLMLGGVGGAALTLPGCKESPNEQNPVTSEGLYGRTPEELARDERLASETYFEESEIDVMAHLCDIILPAKDDSGGALDAEVPKFIEFIVKDLPDHQLPLRGGIMWLNGESNRRFNSDFVKCSESQKKEVIDEIAYPDPENKKPDLAAGRKFFDRMRNLTLTGYYTSKIGLQDLGYKGNVPNVWDGVPEDVLKDHDVDYDEEWLAKCVDQSKREIIAEWDEQGNLLT